MSSVGEAEVDEEGVDGVGEEKEEEGETVERLNLLRIRKFIDNRLQWWWCQRRRRKLG